MGGFVCVGECVKADKNLLHDHETSYMSIGLMSFHVAMPLIDNEFEYHLLFWSLLFLL